MPYPERSLPREDQRQRSVHQPPPKFPSRCLPRPSQPLLLPSYRSSHHRQDGCSLRHEPVRTWSLHGSLKQHRPEPKYLHQQSRSRPEHQFRAGNQNPSEQHQLPAERQHWQLELRYPSFQPGQCREGSERLVRDR